MKPTFVSLLGIIFFTFGLSAQKNDPVVMTINGEPILKSEFEYIYNKNNANNALDKKNLDEYVELFVNFKLKVAEAKAKGINLRQSYIDEFETYRNQLAAPYMADKESEEEIIREAYNRMKEDVDAGHILIKTSRADTMEAYEKIYQIYEQLKKGANFEALAIEYSQCPSASKGGRLGYVTAFMTVYPFETAVYNTPVGTFSAPVRTSFGYHIVKTYDRRPTKGSVRIGHIYKRVENESQLEMMKQKADSLYRLLKKGADFEEIARKYSDDQQSSGMGGDMGWIEAGRLPVDFENAAFALQKNGELSGVIQTPFGFHILKLLDKKGLDSYENIRDELKTKVLRDERASKLTDSYFEKLKKKHGAKLTKEELIAAEQKALENEHPEYRNLLREYSDGLLLFEISNEEVWNKASVDVEGLEKFFEANKENYKWETPRFRGKVLHAVNENVLAEAKKFIATAPKDSVDFLLRQKFNKEKIQLKIENGLFAPGANKVVDAQIFKKGTFTDENFPAVATIGNLVSVPESYKDVRGPVTADYQNYLEEEWIKSLRKKYEVKIDEKVLRTIKSN